MTQKTNLIAWTLVAVSALSAAAWSDPMTPAKDIWTELRREAPEVAPYVVNGALPMEWESINNPERKLWSQYGYDVINENFDDLDRASDMDQFCPNYAKLASRDQKIQVWMAIFVGVSHWESSWNPAEHTYEGKTPDLVTKRPTYSEGLMQLSYQDTIQWKYAHCPLDWEKDQKLAPDDLHRSILNPFINLACAIRIEAGLIRDHGSINHSDPWGYWSTLGSHGRNGKAKSIAAEVSQVLPFCGPPVKGQFFKENLTRFGNLKLNRKIVQFWRSAFSAKHSQETQQNLNQTGNDCQNSQQPGPVDQLGGDLSTVFER